VAYDRDAAIDAVLAGAAATVQRYGCETGSDWRLGPVAIDPPWTSFEVLRAGSPFGRFRTRMIGRHNLLKALAVTATADHIALVADLQRQGRDAAFFPDTESIIAAIVDAGRSGDVVLIMSNGSFDNIHERLLDAF
jgi:UDP-N-acetylmuramate-alanine ligase